MNQIRTFQSKDVTQGDLLDAGLVRTSSSGYLTYNYGHNILRLFNF